MKKLLWIGFGLIFKFLEIMFDVPEFGIVFICCLIGFLVEGIGEKIEGIGEKIEGIGEKK